jgi:glycosyltransferase 2 family protein
MSLNKNILSILKFSFFLGLGVFLVWYSLHKIDDKDYNDFKQSLASAKYWMIIPVFIILSTSHLLRSLRWKLLMEPMGYKPSLANTFFAVMIGYLANFAFPRLGEVLKCTILSKYEDVPAEKNVGTIVAERAFDVVCLLVLFLTALILEHDVVMAAYHKLQQSAFNKGENSNTGLYVKLAMFTGIIITILFLVITKKWNAFFGKIKTIFKGIGEGLTSAWRLKQKKLFIFYSLSIWVLYLLGTYIGLYATAGTSVGFRASISCLAFASIGMIITPGGIGAYAILTALVLELYNVPYSLGLANGTLQWFAQFIIILVVGFICLILLPIYNRKKNL